MHFFQSYSLEEDISKIAFWENINLKSSSESSGPSEELFKPSIICLITFFQYIYTILKIFMDNSFHLY